MGADPINKLDTEEADFLPAPPTSPSWPGCAMAATGVDVTHANLRPARQRAAQRAKEAHQRAEMHIAPRPRSTGTPRAGPRVSRNRPRPRGQRKSGVSPADLAITGKGPLGRYA
jgi:hypothetical protein